MNTYAKLLEIEKGLEKVNERIDALQKIFYEEIERRAAEVKAAQEKATKKGSK